jgi:hypothetical protein
MKKLLLLLLIFLLSGCSKINLGASSDISSLALTNKYNLATEIKSKYALENTALKMVAKNDPKDMVRVTVGNETTGLGAESEFVPSVKISRWDEVSLKLTPKGLDKIDSKDKKVSFEGNKIKYETPKQNFELYDLPISEDLSEGGFEFEWILKEKPASNIVEFDIETEGLEFLYQPSYLSMRDFFEKRYGQDITIVEDRVIRNSDGKTLSKPLGDNIIHSYAVYASENKTNWEGGKEYKIGKIGHIYRPKIIDQAGNWVWGILNVDKEKGILSVEIPQDFLDKAIYPVRHAAGLTFGYTTAGSEYVISAYNDFTGTQWTSPSDISNISDINAYTFSDGGDYYVKLMVVLLSNLNIVSDSISSPLLCANGVSAWRKHTYVSPPSISPSTNYILGFTGSSGDAYVLADVNASYTSWYDYSNNYTTPTNPTDAEDDTSHYLMSIYATYTASAGATYCGHTGGDWYVNSTCWISANTTTPGNVYIGTGGSLNCNNGAIISARSRSVGNGGSYSIGNSGGNCGWSLWTPQ